MSRIVPGYVDICVGQEQQFTAQGEGIELVEWSSDPPGHPAIGSGTTFATVWHVPGYKTVTASCCGTSRGACVSVIAVAKVIIDGSEPEDEGPAAICYSGSIIVRAKPDPAGASFPDGSPNWEFVEKPPHSQLQNPPVGETAHITPDLPGTYKIKASCGTSSRTFTVHAVIVTFDPFPVRTGFTRPLGASTISRTVVATVEPASAADFVQLEVAGADRITLGEPSIDTQAGTITFEVKGKRATPAHFPGGDTTVEAVVGGNICTGVPAIVIVPARIREPYPQAVGNIQPQNLVLDRTTSPGYPVRENRVALVTIWFHWLTVTVEDQFGNVLDELYEGADVEERRRRVRFSINQPLSANGTYQDPVGVYSRPPIYRVLADSQAAQDWPQEETLPMVRRTDRQDDIRVFVGGHDIGTIVRDVIGTPDNHVEIRWPP